MFPPATSSAAAAPVAGAPAGASSPAQLRATLVAAQRRSAELEQQLTTAPGRFRVLTGDRPTGPLHLGHYVGTLANRVCLQAAGVEVFLVIADYQVITDRDRTGDVRANVRELLLDYLAAGIVPRTGTGSAPE